MQHLRVAFQASLVASLHGYRRPRTVSPYRALLRDEPMVWTFLDAPGLPLTPQNAPCDPM
jgi:hypothetical protein